MDKRIVVEKLADVAANGVLGGIMILNAGVILKTVDTIFKNEAPTVRTAKMVLSAVGTGYAWRYVERAVIKHGTLALQKMSQTA